MATKGRVWCSSWLVAVLGGGLGWWTWDSAASRRVPERIRVGVCSEAESEAVQQLALERLSERGVVVDLVEYVDAPELDAALARQEVDVRAHRRGDNLELDFVGAGGSVAALLQPMVLFSKSSSLDVGGEVVGLPVDPSARGQALRLLEQAGLVSLDVSTLVDGWPDLEHVRRDQGEAPEFAIFGDEELQIALERCDIVVWRCDGVKPRPEVVG